MTLHSVLINISAIFFRFKGEPSSCVFVKQFLDLTSLSLKRQLRHKTDKIHECKVCHKCFARKDTLKTHMDNIHTKCSRHVCDKCGKYYCSKASLFNHKAGIHDLKRFKCKICENTFVSKHSMIRHEKTHEEKEKCPNCKKHFTRLKDHLYKCENQSRPKCFTCECGKTFKEKKYLAEHRKYKHGPKRYQCPKCSSVFAHRKSLNFHKRRCWLITFVLYPSFSIFVLGTKKINSGISELVEFKSWWVKSSI